MILSCQQYDAFKVDLYPANHGKLLAANPTIWNMQVINSLIWMNLSKAAKTFNYNHVPT